MVAQRRGRNPHFGKRAAAQQQRETAGVDGIALVRFANALFRFQRIGEMRDVLGALHLVDDPIPVTGGLEGDVRVFGKLREKTAVAIQIVRNANGLGLLSIFVHGDEHGVVLEHHSQRTVS